MAARLTSVHDAPSEPADLRSTRGALRLGNGAPFHHISTLAVPLLIEPRLADPGRAPSATLLPDDARVLGGYAQGRLAAERLVAKGPGPWEIHRLGLLADPEMPRGLQLPEVVRGLAVLGAIPDSLDGSLAFDLTDLRAAAEAVVDRLLRPSPPHGEVHHHHGRRTTLDALCAAFAAAGRPLQRLPDEAWRGVARAHPEAAIAVGALRSRLPDAQAGDRPLDLFLGHDLPEGALPGPDVDALIGRWLSEGR